MLKGLTAIRGLDVASHRRLRFVLAAALVVRIGLVFVLGQPWNESAWRTWIWTNDTDGYLQLAEDWSDGSQDELSFRLPGYPVFLLLTRHLLGIEWLGSIVAHQILIVACGYLIAVLLAPLIGSYFLVAVIAFLCEPFLLIYSYKLLPETVTVCAQIAASFVLLKALPERWPRLIGLSALSGLLLIAGAMAKPVLLFAYAGFALMIVLFARSKWWAKSAAIAALVIVTQLPLYALREMNQARFGYEGLCTQDAWEKAARALAVRNLAERGEIRMIELRAELDSLARSGEGGDHPRSLAVADSVYREVTRNTLRQYWGSAIKYEFALAYMFFQPATMDLRSFLRLPVEATSENFIGSTRNLGSKLLSRMRSPSGLIIALFSLGYSAVLLAGFGLANLRWKMAEFRPILGLIIGWLAYTVVLIGPLAQARYRVTFAWALCLSVGIAWHWLRFRKQSTSG